MNNLNQSETQFNPSSEESMIQVFLVDDHELLRAGMRMLLENEPGYEICGEAGGEAEAIERIDTVNPQLAIVDLTLNSGGGLELIKRLTSSHPDMRLLIASMHDERLYGSRAMRAGAHGYVSKQAPAATLLKAIATVLEGRQFFNGEPVTRFPKSNQNGPNQRDDFSQLQRLSDRELEIFQMIGEGLSTGSIAEKMSLSPSTIGTYRERLKTKLNLGNSRELTHLAMQWVIQKNEPPRDPLSE